MNTEFRILDIDGVRTAAEWARREGWNPGLEDATAFAAMDPEGFLGLYAGGDLAATISLVSYGAFGFLGFYICRPDLRGKGLGLALWNHSITHKACATIGLDGVTAQQDNYRKSGFVLAHENIRYGGPKPEELAAAAGLHPLSASDAPEIEAFEQRHRFFPAPRQPFLAKWLGQHKGLALRAGGAITGYGVIRPCHEGYKIGPLFAEGPEDARVILAGLLAGLPEGAVFFLDVPATNPQAVALAKSFKLEPKFETARMYRGPAPDLNMGQTFGITTFELG